MRILSRTTLVVAALVAVMAFPDWSQAIPAPGSSSPAPTLTRADSLVAIDRLTRLIAEANPEYPDPYKVPIGATIRVPVDDPAGHKVVVEYKTEPWQLGQNGCFWQIAEGHLAGTLTPAGRLDIPPAFTAEPLVSVPAPAPIQDSQSALSWMEVLTILVILGICVALVGAVQAIMCRNRSRMERELNPATHPPVVRGGLSEDPRAALQQVQAATLVQHGPNRFVQSVERGTLRDTRGRQSFVAPMEHGDGVTRNKKFNAGDACYRVQVRIGSDQAEPVTEYWFRHCGNRFGEIKSGQFQLPDGWEFIPTPNQAPARAPEPAPALDAEDAEAADSIEGAAARIHAHTQALATVNPTGEFTIEITEANGSPESHRTLTVRSTGHRPIRSLKLRDGKLTEVSS